MKATSYFILSLLIITAFFSPHPAVADDNDIFGVASQTVEPNLLIIFDTSGSMTNNHVQVCTGPEVCREEKGDCSAGHWERIRRRWKWVCDEWETRTVCEDTCTDAGTRTEVAKQVINDLIDEHAGENRFGIMRFHSSENETEGGYIPKQTHNGVDLYATCSVKDYFILDGDGEQKTGADYDSAIADYKAFLHTVVNALPGSGSTPLKETLAEAGLYFAEEESWYNPSNDNYYPKGTYPGTAAKAYNPNVTHIPMGYECRQNYIILMTDGEPTRDENSKLSGTYLNGEKFNNGNLPGLDDISGFLFEHDMNANLDGVQNIITYAIGFNGGDPVELQDTADRGMGAGDNDGVDDGGLYFDAVTPEDLSDAFEMILGSIDQRRTTFTAAVVPISDVSKAYAGDQVYMSLFQPVSGQSRWIGNLKKYSLNSDNEFASCGTEDLIMDDAGMILDAAKSCWSPYSDGAQVDKGGAGHFLSAMEDTSRKIYSNISGSDLTATANAFTTTNANILPSAFGETTTAAKDIVINKIRMVDDPWKLGDLNHSKPAVADYSGDDYIFVGSNDGMLHCFNDTTGTEAWAFVPTEQFSRLQEVYTGDHSYFMDGSPTVIDTAGNQKLAIIGERRGGNHYYAMNVSSVASPSYLYTYTTDGQSWKQPQFMTVKTAADTSSEVFLLTGGYDDHYDSADTVATGIGNSVRMINATSGSLVKQFDDTNITAMTDSIISAYGADVIDDGKNIVNQIYAADMEGRLFGFRDNNNESAPKELDGTWQARHVFSATSSGKKMFEESDFVRDYMKYYDSTDDEWKTVVGDYVFFGTGDRANPMRTDNTNYFYCVKNDWHTEDITTNKIVSDFSTLNDINAGGDAAEKVMLDVTDNKIQDGTEAEQKAVQKALKKRYNRGWYIKLEGLGEKCLSTPVVYDGIVYFTTFTPPADAASSNSDPCESPSGGGTAKLYAVDYKTGAPVYPNFSETGEDGEPTKEDRSTSILSEYVTIAPNPLLIITEVGEKLLTGPEATDVKSRKQGLNPFYWISQ